MLAPWPQARAAQRAAKAARDETLLWKGEAARLQQELTRGHSERLQGNQQWQQQQFRGSFKQSPSLACNGHGTSAPVVPSQSGTAREVSHVYELMSMHCQVDELQSRCSHLQGQASAAQRVRQQCIESFSVLHACLLPDRSIPHSYCLLLPDKMACSWQAVQLMRSCS